MNGERSEVSAKKAGIETVRSEASPLSPLTSHLSPGYDLAELRRVEFPWTRDTIYLNHASVGPLPERTRLTLESFNRKRAAPHQLPDRELIATLAESRRLAAELVGAIPEEIALSINTGFGLSLAARALPLHQHE